VTTSYEYDPTKKFVLKGKVENDGVQQLRTCYSYDAVGRLLSETNPLGTGATCP
jgi:YD repeat-containing protein